MTHRRAGAGRDHRRKGCREDELWRIAAHGVDKSRAGSDIAAERAIPFRQSSFNDVDTLAHAFTLADAAAACTIHADRMNLVHIGQRIVFFRQCGNFRDRCDVAVHRIEALKDNQLGPVAPRSDKQFLEMLDVIVPPDLLLAAGATYALDH